VVVLIISTNFDYIDTDIRNLTDIQADIPEDISTDCSARGCELDQR